jgi:hypothetical protein
MERDDVEGTMGGREEMSGGDEGAGMREGPDRENARVELAPDLDDPASVEADARAERLDRVAVLYAQITAATRAFLAAVAECDRHRDWAVEGFGSCAEWLAWRIGLRRNAARERVRVARTLEDLPQTSEAMARGELSYSKVRALTRVATSECEGELLELARSCSTADLERVVRAYKTLSRADEAKREQVLHRTRRFGVVPDEEGMYVVRGRLTPEVGAVLMRAIDAAGDALYRADTERDETEPAQRRADAVGLLAQRALAAGFGTAGSGADGDGGADEASDANDAPISGSKAERYQVMLYVEPETLRETGEPGLSELEDGTRVSAETARRLTCDASLVEVTRTPGTGGPRACAAGSEESGGGCVSGASRSEESECASADCGSETQAGLGRPTVLDVGRRTRTVPTALRRGSEARDRGCRFPGCGLRFTEGHHILHWADGGETKLSNLVLLCERHHRRVHEGGWRVCSDRTGEQVVFFTPAGRPLSAAPPLRPERLGRSEDTTESDDAA